GARIDHYFRDALGFRQAGKHPGLACVRGSIDAVADGHAVTCPGLPGAYPDVLMIRGVDSDRAYRLHRLIVKHRFESGGSVRGFPDAAACGAHEQGDLAGGVIETSERRNPAAHRRRADVTGAEARD